jgi:hypothetical protein
MPLSLDFFYPSQAARPSVYVTHLYFFPVMQEHQIILNWPILLLRFSHLQAAVELSHRVVTPSRALSLVIIPTLGTRLVLLLLLFTALLATGILWVLPLVIWESVKSFHLVVYILSGLGFAEEMVDTYRCGTSSPSSATGCITCT